MKRPACQDFLRFRCNVLRNLITIFFMMNELLFISLEMFYECSIPFKL